ncbi:alanyl-tRNA editing protein [Campylobacter hyointestinalis]|uniref:Alanyl-tRNA synthetase n=1 Tax=Campylobacter hyointestinalis subsp. hyointestinalis TaxID=91352 RepID=A0A9W5EZW5_CAMHY|nr:alanyl-tRNA editing protein [Campylobacter hyointestinalis]CUU74950.1 Alanyl-tRNA synthetase [Campylobacter hyointestinalis subsp. hyointestinalis]CUU81513.1 Alanyl-tRNA synthetase [Campylobacter hyointestinalis subsp. hyointestinalis]
MTIKEYYNDGFLMSCEAVVTKICDGGVVLDKTVAYAVGGGQDGDSGFLVIGEEEVPFFDTTKFGGVALKGGEFDGIVVSSDILHHVNECDLSKFKIGQKITVRIDVEKRAKLTMNHSGIHIALMALNELRPRIKEQIYGCKIDINGARLDFKVDEKFSQEELDFIEKRSNEYIKNELEMLTYPSSQEPEALYWECDGYKMPCGGTHFKNTKYLGQICVKRKNIGKGVDRMKIEFLNYDLPLNLYHD